MRIARQTHLARRRTGIVHLWRERAREGEGSVAGYIARVRRNRLVVVLLLWLWLWLLLLLLLLVLRWLRRGRAAFLAGNVHGASGGVGGSGSGWL